MKIVPEEYILYLAMKRIIKMHLMVIFPTDGGKTYAKCTKDKINDKNLRSMTLELTLVWYSKHFFIILLLVN